MSKLLSPFQLGSLELPNRVVFAPLTRARADVSTRSANDLQAIYYTQRASAGLIIAEATAISDAGMLLEPCIVAPLSSIRQGWLVRGQPPESVRSASVRCTTPRHFYETILT
jgi:NADH:flavin oxidoreductase / NADH oxidase family